MSDLWRQIRLLCFDRERRVRVVALMTVLLSACCAANAQEVTRQPSSEGYLLRACVDKGDTILMATMPTLHVYPPYKFRNKREKARYDKLVRDVKKTLPIARQINDIIIETYEYLNTIPTKKERQKHIKRVEKSLKAQYTPVMKKLTFSQGKLLIKLVDRECNQSTYELVKAFMGPLRAGFYQAFAKVMGASLKKEYDPTGEDHMVERIINLVESGQI